FNLGGAIAGYTGTVGLGGALSTWKNTPREKALRQVIGTAVNYVVSKTPKNYYRHGDIVQESTRGLDDSSTATAVAASDGEKVVITASSLNVRSGPNVSNNAAFSLSSGTVVDVVNRTEGWLQIVDQGGRSGWVAEQFTLALSAN
ncbi:MAG: SH3 domain-containing protein, partial [Xanthomonadales bacterium]|nr:SH3 domain-containing protein [Xanthomonadales bacterium]